MEISSLLHSVALTLPPNGLGHGQAFTHGQAAEKYGGGVFSSRKFKVDKTDAATFAADILQRLESGALTGTDQTALTSNASLSASLASNAALSGALASNAAGNLQSALASAIDYVRDNYGDQAATAVMGIIWKATGNGKIDEGQFGDGLVSALKFIDKNFGFAAGDNAMAFFNGSLNDAVNRYFDNGANEQFYAVDGTSGGAGQVQQALAATLQTVANQYGDDTAQAVADILANSLKESGLTREGLKKAAEKVKAYLKENFGGGEGDDSLNLLGLVPGTTVDKGALLDVAV